MMRGELFIAIRHITARRRQSALSGMAIAVGLAVFIVMSAMMAGFTGELITLTVENSPSVVVQPKQDNEYIYLYKGVEDYVLGIEGVSDVSPVLSLQGIASYKDRGRGVSITGFEPAKETKILPFEKKMVEGSIYDISHSQSRVILGDGLAEYFELRMGNRITLTASSGESSQFEVVGIVDTATPLDEQLVLVSLPAAQRLAGAGDVVSTIEIKTFDIYAAQPIADRIRTETGYEANSWIELNVDIFKTIELESTFMNIFYVFIMVIVGLGIANSLLMMVFEKTRDVGMLKAMGASSGQVRNIFLFESVLLCVPGLVLGTALGIGLASILSMYELSVPSEVYILNTMPVAIHLTDVLILNIFVLVITVLAGVYPARKASQLNPVEALSYE